MTGETGAALPSPSPLAVHWALDPDVVYLNHGSFGACPVRVLEAQDGWRRRMESELVRFFIEELEPAIDRTRDALAPLVKCAPTDLAMVPNATVGVGTVLANLELGPGDEVVATSHEYPACMNNLERVSGRAGATIVPAPLPFPTPSSDALAEAVLERLTPRTRLVLVSHVTSPTATILPVDRIVAECNARGIDTLVDGAHAPGFVDLDLSALSPTYYAANCHKWLCAPKGAGFLYVRTDRQPSIRPLVLSNHAKTARADRSKFNVEFDYIGTRDSTAWFTVADAIEGMASLVDGGWPAIRKANRSLAMRARDHLCERLGVEPPVPDMSLGSMAVVPLPPHAPDLDARLASRPTRHHDALQDALIDRHSIQVPIWRDGLSGIRFVRVSAQLYNAFAQYARLGEALLEELDRERRLA